ncbi:MAG TPA: amino acid adenylation domain-containing protein, partial [Puia sp.]|nr:amino acid adenylation domain-containing protein [Puia sp.]
MKAKIEKSNVLEIFELSSIQKGILFHYLRDSGSHIYNVQLVFDIRGSLDKDRLDRAVAAVQRQNPVLRSVFSWEKVSKPLQILLKTYPRPFEYIDISGIGTQERQASLQRCLEEDRQERFDLETLALRLKLIKTSPDTFVFSITHHHILYDGWSTGLLLTELFLAYRHPDREPIKPDYPGIYRRHAGRNLPEDGRRYWRAYLEDYQMHSLLPPIRDRNHTVNSFRVGRPMAALDRFSAQHRVTKAALIYAAFGLLLQKYANSSDVVFGTPVADRDPAIPGIERLIGNFINTLPLRVTATDEATLLDIVLRVHADMADRHEHSHHSYAEIKDVLKLRPDENLFEITVAVENYPLDKTAIEGIEGLSVTLRSSYEFTDSPIAVNVFFGADLGVSIAYDLAFADEAFARQLAEHFLAILDKICDDPFCLVHRLDILSDAERRLLLETFNDTAAEFPETETIVSLFEKQVSRTPDNTAICCDGKIFSYRTVYEEMNRIAAGLTTTYALGAGDVAGVLMMKSERLLITILAILKTGASYLPIDLSNPPDRVAYMVEDSDMKLLITDQPSVSAITPSGLSVLGYETLQAAAGWSGNMTGAPCWPDYLAYTIYTSGSTGMPKGVGLKHRGFVNLIYWYAKALAGTETDNYLLIAPVSFDLAQKNIFTPLLTGASITLSEDIQLDYGRMAATIASKGVTVINCAPSAWYPLLEEAAHNGYRDLAGVRKVVLGGENIHMKAFEGWFHSGNFHAQLINSYGPTECTDVVAWHQLEDPVHRAYDRVPIGRPVDNMRLYILDRQGALQPLGALGEICIGGTGVSDGYRNNPELTRRKFFPDAISGKGMLYRTGDAGRWLRNGEMEFIGRIDNQVKIRGFRVEPGEIEVQLSRHERVRQCAVIVGEKEAEKFLVAYYVADHPLESAALRAFLSARLPHYMVPAWYVHLTSLPRTPNGKLDRRALPSPQIRAESEQTVPTRAMEKKLLAIWCDVLGQTRIGVTDNFFDVGGDSLKLITVSSRIRVDMEKQVPVTELLQYPTIRTLADHLQPAVQKNREQSNAEPSAAAKDIAIIGMACRFPGAPDVDAFWGNLRAGRESITREGDADISGEYRLVRAKGLLEGYECFDAAFFNYSPADAKLMDPQIRIFHETVWEALEHAGYRCPSFPGRIGLYAGATPSPYYELDTSKPQGDQLLEEWASLSYADKDFLCARVSYKLNLRGPSLNINTACSTSLVATDLACQELMAGKCEMAVAGGISVTLHDNEGYIYHKGMVMSPDGRCRAFDAEAAGTVGGNGSGAVVLRRLEDALRDGDTIYAVIKGTATNNDGNRKVGFTAPGVDGQAAVISHAMRKAGVRPEDIGYVEAHGSGTLLGDPIEVAALVEAFGTDKRAYCGLGSVKTNIGHLDAAAGIAGLIKTVLALYHGEIPPSLHFHQPNPNLELGASPFYINDRLRDWQKDGRPRTAGVSSFGIGGTNAHIILQEAPPRSAGSASRSHQLLLLSARSENALAANSARLADHLQAMADEEHSGRTAEQQALADLAYTLQTGREPMPYRRMIVCDTVVQAIEQLSIFPVNGKTSPLDESLANRVVFLFPGQGAQYSGMCRGLYEKEPYFREQMDSCLAIVRQLSGKDLKPLIFGGSRRLHDTETAQPALFVVEYALARLLMKWGILPHLMIGHSFGEYVAACLSGVFSLEDALSIVVKRGELMQQAPGGISLGVAVSEEVLTSWLEKYPGVSLATVNSSELCVVSGQAEQIEAFRKEMVICGYPSEVVSEAHAFHSSRMDGILEAFASHIRQIHPATPRIPFVSNLTGEVATADAVTGTAYWVDHLRKTVRFADGIRTLMKEEHMVFVEVGPGIELSSFVRSMRERGPGHKVINMVRHAQTEGDDQYHLEKGIGRLWLIGIEPAWGSFYEGETRRRVPLPSYAFDRVCFPVRNKRPVAGTAKTEEDLVRSKDISRWWYAPTWRHVPLLPEPAGSDGSCTLLLDDDLWIGAGVAEVLRGYGERVILVRKAAAYKNDGD